MTPARKRPRRRGRGDAGETLVESLITMVIMSIAFAAILFAIGTAIRFSGTHRDQADADVALGAAAEAVKAADTGVCPYSGVLNSIPQADLPAGWTTANLAIANPQPSCAAPLQTVTIRATAPDGKASETVAVVKRST